MKLSIIIPVYKEKNIDIFLKELMENLKIFQYEIIIVDGDKHGSTIDKISLTDVIRLISDQKGRGHQLQKGVTTSTGDVVVFLHADTKIVKENFIDILNAMVKGYDYGAFRLKIDGKGLLFRIIEKAVYLRTLLFKLPYGDQTIFIKKDTIKSIGGVRSISLFEDVELMLRCKKIGLKFYFSQKYSVTSPRRWEKYGIISTTVRDIFLLISYLLGRDVDLLYKKYYK
ncbi:MAG: glycosyltransferase [Deferribacterales bacterium]